MKIYWQCYPCILKQIAALIEMSGLSDSHAKELMNSAAVWLHKSGEGITTQHIIRRVYDYFESVTGDSPFDPYKAIKEESNRIVMEAIPDFEAQVEHSEDPFAMAVRGAAAGNIIDYGASAGDTVAIEDEIRNIPGLRFAVNHLEEIRAASKAAKTIVYLGDNAGELLFDRVLIKQLHLLNPDASIFLALRDKPIINDVVFDEADFLDLPENARIISSGSRYPGTILEETTDVFQDLFHEADVIISKGQGNFETLCGQQHSGLFFVLRIKCAPVARVLDAPVGQLVLKRMQNG